MTRNRYACPALEPEIELNEIEVNLEPLRYASQENHERMKIPMLSHPMCLIQSYMYQPPMIVGCSFHPVEVRSEDVIVILTVSFLVGLKSGSNRDHSLS